MATEDDTMKLHGRGGGLIVLGIGILVGAFGVLAYLWVFRVAFCR